MSKILVLTGATGKKSGGALMRNISRNIDAVKELFPNGIRAVVRATSNTKELEKAIPGVQICVGELTDTVFLTEAFKDADTVLHIAGIHWSREAVTAAAKSGIRRLILVHTTGIYSKYKAAGEEYRQIDDCAYKICKRWYLTPVYLLRVLIA